MSEKKFEVGDKIIYYPPIDETSTAQQIRFAGRNGTIKRISPTTHCIGVSADIEFKNYFGCDIPLTHLEHKIVPPVNFIDFTYDFFKKEEKKFEIGDEVVFWAKDTEGWLNSWIRRNGTKAIIIEIFQNFCGGVLIYFKDKNTSNFVSEKNVYPISEMVKVGDKYYPRNSLHHMYIPEHINVSANMLGMPSYLHRIHPYIFGDNPDNNIYSCFPKCRSIYSMFSNNAGNQYVTGKKVDMYPNSCPKVKALSPENQIAEKLVNLNGQFEKNERKLDKGLENCTLRIEQIEKEMEYHREEFTANNIRLKTRIEKLENISASINWDTASEELQKKAVETGDAI